MATVAPASRDVVAVYARMSSTAERVDLDRRVAGVTTWATGRSLTVSRVVSEVGSAFDGCGKKFLALLRDPAVTTVVVEYRDRFARFGGEYVEAALTAHGRRLLVVDPAEVDDDLVRDVTEILTSLCARLYGRRAAAYRARAGIDAATGERPGVKTMQAYRFALDLTPGQERAFWRTPGRRGWRTTGRWPG